MFDLEFGIFRNLFPVEIKFKPLGYPRQSITRFTLKRKDSKNRYCIPYGDEIDENSVQRLKQNTRIDTKKQSRKRNSNGQQNKSKSISVQINVIDFKELLSSKIYLRWLGENMFLDDIGSVMIDYICYWSDRAQPFLKTEYNSTKHEDCQLRGVTSG